MKTPIAIVDDDESVRSVISSFLATAGHEPITFPDGESLLRELDNGTKPALFLLDIMMPRMDGFELCAALRARRELADVPIVFLTAMSEAMAEARAVEVGIDDVLSKPVRRSELLVRIRSLLRYAASKRALRDAYRTAQLQNAELVAAAGRQRELAAMVVHDLKNPLASLGANLRFVGTRPESPDARDAILDSIELSDLMLRRVATILELARNASGRLVANAESVSVREELNRIVQHERRRAERRKLILTTQCPEMLTLSADRELLRRMLENLTDNALRFADQGSEVRLAVERSADAIIVEVTNTSSTLDVSARDQLFSSFSHPPSVDGDDVLHVGLGLSFCRIAARALGARFELVESAPRVIIARIVFPVSK